jgi:2-methylcitrate dehydratase PrpD
MEATERIAQFISSYPAEKISEEARRRTTAAVLDYTAVLLAGVDEDSARLVRRTVYAMGGTPQASVWGTDVRTSPMLAALANGTAAHALDLDDTNRWMMSHPSIQLLPGLFALGEHQHRNGREVIDAYVVGFEVGTTLGRAFYPNLITEGWFPVGVLGTVMQAAACARLLGLPSNQARMALGIATNLASGLRCNNGTMAKPLMAGQVGSNGVLAALLAKEGMTADEGAIEAQFGYFSNFSRAEPDQLVKAVDSLGDGLEILSSGISHKLHACCAGGHIPIDCTLEIVSTAAIDADAIEEVEVSVHHGVQYFLIHSRPTTGAEAKFSLEYAVARALLDGRMGPEQFVDAKVVEPQVRALIEKVKPAHYGEPIKDPADAEGPFPVEVRVKMRDGTVHSAGAEHARGTEKNPLTWADLVEKFRQCTAGRLAEPSANMLIETVKNLDTMRDVTELIAPLSPRARYHHGMEVRS